MGLLIISPDHQAMERPRILCGTYPFVSTLPKQKGNQYQPKVTTIKYLDFGGGGEEGFVRYL